MQLPVHRRDDDAEAEFQRLRRSFRRQLDRWHDFVRPPHDTRDRPPALDVHETDEAFLLDVELPAVRRRDVELLVDGGGQLRLTALRRERTRGGLRHSSRDGGRLAVSLALPLPVDADRVTADLDHGVLRVVVPKAADVRRRRIPVAHGDQPVDG